MIQHPLEEIASGDDCGPAAAPRVKHETNTVEGCQASEGPRESVTWCQRSIGAHPTPPKTPGATPVPEPPDGIASIGAVEMRFNEEGDNGKVFTSERHFWDRLGRLTDRA